jgi:hypothetical protein
MCFSSSLSKLYCWARRVAAKARTSKMEKVVFLIEITIIREYSIQ